LKTSSRWRRIIFFEPSLEKGKNPKQLFFPPKENICNWVFREQKQNHTSFFYFFYHLSLDYL
jgi:hypothetical protein